MRIYLKNTLVEYSDGLNLTVPAFELGYIDYNGVEGADPTMIRSSDYIALPEGTTTILMTGDFSCLNLPSNYVVEINIHEYNSSKGSVRRNGYQIAGNNVPYKLLSTDTKYVRITTMIRENGTGYNYAGSNINAINANRQSIYTLNVTV